MEGTQGVDPVRIDQRLHFLTNRPPSPNGRWGGFRILPAMGERWCLSESFRQGSGPHTFRGLT